jgi:Rad3-related DNA helicase
MNDAQIVDHIDKLVAEEHQLEREHGEQGLSEEQRQRLQQIEVHLDQCWDLLRQRRALRDFGEDPGEAEVRPADVVERYQQ